MDVQLKRRWIWVAGTVAAGCIVLAIFWAVFSGVGHIGQKRGLVLGDKGWELSWINSTALPPDWDSTFKVVCQVPGEVISGIFGDLSAPDSPVREKLAAFRSDLDGVEAYAVEIDPDEFSTTQKRGMRPVALPGSKETPEHCVRCTMILAGQGDKIRVPELEGHEIVYVSAKILKSSIEARLE